MTQDATAGYWEPNAILHKASKPPTDLDTLDYLSPQRRHQILLSELSCLFNVKKKTGDKGAVVSLGTTPLSNIEKPAWDFTEQLKLVRGYSDLRTDRIPEILVQLDDIVSFFASAMPMNPYHHRKTIQLISVVHALIVQIEMHVKHYCWMARPAGFATQVQPVIQTPDHSTFPSGHAVEATALAAVLHWVRTGIHLGEVSATADRPMELLLAHRIAVNRTVAGVHFPVDSAAGAVLGATLGEAICSLHAPGTTANPNKMNVRHFTATENTFGEEEDFLLSWLEKTLNNTNVGPAVPETPVLFRKLLGAAIGEWR
ncbi:MAG: phosphatase PAP2 family protein [Sulfitobacter sp.]